jgi:hypothetical protein
MLQYGQIKVASAERTASLAEAKAAELMLD